MTSAMTEVSSVPNSSGKPWKMLWRASQSLPNT